HVLVTVKGADGSPAAGLTVAAVESEVGPISWVVTDNLGRADVFVPPGAYLFRVVVNGDYFESGPDGHCVVAGGLTASLTAPVCTDWPDGTPCNDGNVCTQGDACVSGVCQGQTPFACTAPDACRDEGTCNSGAPATGPPPAAQDLIGWWKLDGDGHDSSNG